MQKAKLKSINQPITKITQFLTPQKNPRGHNFFPHKHKSEEKISQLKKQNKSERISIFPRLNIDLNSFHKFRESSSGVESEKVKEVERLLIEYIRKLENIIESSQDPKHKYEEQIILEKNRAELIVDDLRKNLKQNFKQFVKNRKSKTIEEMVIIKEEVQRTSSAESSNKTTISQKSAFSKKESKPEPGITIY